MMYTEDTEILFMKSDGNVATTYFDYLEDLNHSLYSYLEGLQEESDVSTTMTYVIRKLENILTDVKYLYMLNLESISGAEILKKFLNIFKSYTADLASLNVTYLLNDRYYNSIPMVHELRFEKSMILDDEVVKDHNHVILTEKELLIKDEHGLFEKDGIVAIIYDEEREDDNND